MKITKTTLTSVGAAMLLSASVHAASVTFNDTISMPNETQVTINLTKGDF